MRRLLAALVLASSLACGSDSTTGPSTADIAGTYTLTTINNSSLPFIISSPSGSTTLTADAITLGPASTWSETYSYIVSGQQRSAAAGGTIVRTGTSITLMTGADQQYAGTISGNTLAVSDGAADYVFTK